MAAWPTGEYVPRTATGEIPSVLQPPQTAIPDPTHYDDPFGHPRPVTAMLSRDSPPPHTAPVSHHPLPRQDIPSRHKRQNGSGSGHGPSYRSNGNGNAAGIEPKVESRPGSPVDQVQARPESQESPVIQPDVAVAIAAEVPEQPEAGPSTVPARKVYARKPAKKKIEKLLQYTTAFVPGLFSSLGPRYNIKNPAGDFLQKETNIDVIRQMSQARVKMEKEEQEADTLRRTEAGEDIPPVQPLAHTLIIHPGSRNLRIGRASDFYPKEVPFCIARPENAPGRGRDPPVPGSRAKRIAKQAKERREKKKAKLAEGDDAASSRNGDDEQGDEDAWIDPVDKHIDDLRDYLRNRLRSNRLSTDYRDGLRVKQFNAKVRPEPINEHNDPYRIDYTEVAGGDYFVGTEAIRLPAGSGFKVRYPLLHRGLNTRDWASPQLLLDDIAAILRDTLKVELGIHARDYSKYSVVLLVPDHADRLHLQAMVSVLFGEFGFKELAIHQESAAAIFSAGMSTACVVDIGATSTSVACVDEGMLNADTRIRLDYGGDDITAALVELLSRANFPYKELDLGRAMDWAMMNKFKERVVTLEEHMVANIAWDIYVLKEQGLTQKYQLRTYDENILAPLCFFDTRMIDFKEKKGSGRMQWWEEDEGIDDQLFSGYDEPTGAMRACTTHLLPVAAPPVITTADVEPDQAVHNDIPEEPKIILEAPASSFEAVERPLNGTTKAALPQAQSANGSPTPSDAPNGTVAPSTRASPTPTIPAPALPAPAGIPASAYDGIDIVGEAAKAPLDAAIAAAISMAGTENKIKAAAGSILLIGGGSALKGLYPFIAERLPPLLRAKGIPISDVSIVPPPRNLNPRFVSWKGASVMCNLESLSDMWIRRDEWEALGARSLKDRLLFL